VRHPETPPLTRAVLLRGIGFGLGVVLAGIGVWLIVTGNTQKRVELGALAGFWGLAVGALAVPAGRRWTSPHDDPVPGVPAPGAAVEMRTATAELERAQEAAARRAHELRLEHMLRHEIQTSVSREVDAIRNEIAELRSELLEKVGGQLRLERTETTRVIGSNLQALQHEVRQLKVAAQEGDFGTGLVSTGLHETGPLRKIVEPARIRPVSRQTAEVEADVQPARQSDAEPAAAAPQRSAPPLAQAPPPAASPAPRAPAPPAPAQPPAAPASATPAPQFDGFAGLPRIRPFTEFALDPIEPVREIRRLPLRDLTSGVDDDDSAYTGRRRRSDEEEAGNGRHVRTAAEPPVRRHRKVSEETDDLLARLLARDS
jgi:hypothetical protein